jgi:hypothetical protein
VGVQLGSPHRAYRCSVTISALIAVIADEDDLA